MLNTSTTGGNIKAQNLSEAIIQSANSPLLAGQFDIFIGKGTEKRLFSLDNAEAGVYAEYEVIPENDTTFADVQFAQKRVGDSVSTSQQFLNDVGIDVTAHFTNILAQRILRGFQGQAFGKGSADGSEATKFQSILDYNAQTSGKINGTDITAFTGVTVANVDSIYGEYVEKNADPAIWVVDSFATAKSLLDGDQKPLLNTDNKVNGSIGTIYGFPVYVQAMNAKAKMVLMNPKAYAVSVQDNVKVTDAKDEKLAKTVFKGEIYAQGKVVNPNAIKIIK